MDTLYQENIRLNIRFYTQRLEDFKQRTKSKSRNTLLSRLRLTILRLLLFLLLIFLV